ncbi:MAG: hypothetical protein A3K19_15225 [Lentisphaerae bacterium RIFOXYB12_FULL_65_16]|nr:MAG: hypothetical protein A3K18_06925 [Lentisphaerae bacterium RIFOXYA12_64_32]OGV88443.1 MAG: hypothetical protein A3K19_15225 [Lentisphaerae bacterium RIFOXYB12_FULL_65_16]
MRMHSSKARWIEEEKHHRRTGDWPDILDRNDHMRFYGNKEWCIWLIDKLVHEKPMLFCGCMQSALACMTNHDFKSVDAWAKWLATERAKSQEDWIRDGFVGYGLHLESPLTKENAEELLRLIGRSRTEESEVPYYIKFNALRWLRDSGFDPWSVDLKDSASQDTRERLMGLMSYMLHLGSSQGNYGAGVLSLVTPPGDVEEPSPPWSEKLVSYIPHWPFATGGLALGLILLVSALLARRKQNRLSTGEPESTHDSESD